MWRKIYEESFLSLGSECSTLKESLTNEIPLFGVDTKAFLFMKFSSTFWKRGFWQSFNSNCKYIYVKDNFASGLRYRMNGERWWQKKFNFKIGKRVIFSDYRMLFILLQHCVHYNKLKTISILRSEFSIVFDKKLFIYCSVVHKKVKQN